MRTRRCSSCREVLPLTAFSPRSDGHTGGYETTCRVCRAAHRRLHSASRRQTPGESLQAYVAQARRTPTQVKPTTRWNVSERKAKAAAIMRLPPGGRCVKCCRFGTKLTIVRRAVGDVPARRISVCTPCLKDYYQPRGLVEAVYAGGNEVHVE